MADIDWTAQGSAVAALATATKAAEAGTRHSIGHITASYSAAQIGLLQVKKGTDVILERYVHNAVEIELPGSGIRGDNNEDVSAELAAGAAGVTGKVAIAGYSR